MKIAYLLGSLNRGGTETLLLDVFRNLQKQGLSAVGVYRKGGNLENDFLESGVPVYKIPPRRNKLKYILQLRSFFKQNDISIVHAQQSLDALYAWVALWFLNTSLVLTFHGYDYENGILSNFISKFIIKRTNANIFVSKSQKKYYLQKYNIENGKRQIVLYNGIFFNKFKFDLRDIRKEFSIFPNVLLLGSVGNFTAVRDQFSLCKFCKLLDDKGITFRFLFIGKKMENNPVLYDDCVKYVVENKLSDKVLFLGSRNDVPNILPQLDAFLYSTDHDTFGIAVIEAIYSGIPVFVNDWEVMEEITDNGKLAILYETRNERDLLDQFLAFMENKTDFILKAKEASKIVARKYSIENHIRQLQKIYLNI